MILTSTILSISYWLRVDREIKRSMYNLDDALDFACC